MTGRTPIIFCPQFDGKLDISDVSRFGAPRVLFRRDLYPDDVDDRMPAVMDHVRREMADFDHDIDFLCLVGSPLYQAACVMVLGQKSTRPVRVLRFDRIERAYYDVTLT